MRLGVRRIPAHGVFEVVLGYHAVVALEDVVQAIVLGEFDGAMVAEDRANHHAEIIGLRNKK